MDDQNNGPKTKPENEEPDFISVTKLREAEDRKHQKRDDIGIPSDSGIPEEPLPGPDEKDD